MVQKVSPSLSQRIFTSVIPENNIVRLVLLVLGGLVFIQIARTLIGRVFPSDHVRNTEAKKYLEEGYKRANETEFKEAELLFLKALSWNPPDVSLQAGIYFGLGIACQDNRKAIEHFNLVLTPSIPNDWRSVISAQLAKRYYQLGEYLIALANLEIALALAEPSFKATILIDISGIYCIMRKYDQAMEKCKEALEWRSEEDNFLDCLLKLSGFCNRQKKHEHSIQYLGLALALLGETRDDQYADVLRLRAKAYYKMGKYDQCFEDFTTALNCSFSEINLKAEILLDRRDVYLAIHDSKAASQDLIAASQCHPTAPAMRDTIISLMEG